MFLYLFKSIVFAINDFIKNIIITFTPESQMFGKIINIHPCVFVANCLFTRHCAVILLIDRFGSRQFLMLIL